MRSKNQPGQLPSKKTTEYLKINYFENCFTPLHPTQNLDSFQSALPTALNPHTNLKPLYQLIPPQKSISTFRAMPTHPSIPSILLLPPYLTPLFQTPYNNQKKKKYHKIYPKSILSFYTYPQPPHDYQQTHSKSFCQYKVPKVIFPYKLLGFGPKPRLQ
jgi:hypothetical protein